MPQHRVAPAKRSRTTPFTKAAALSSSGPVLLRASSLFLSYGSTSALADASIEIRAGEVVAVMGKSGSGKSSLLYCLAGILIPQRGQVIYKGRDLSAMDDDARSEVRRSDFGFVFQFGDLVPELSLRENVALPLRLARVARVEIARRVTELLNVLEIEEQAARRPAEVSGGQAQRAAVARALIHKPQVVFADEPTGSLDNDNSAVVLTELVSLAKRAGSAVVLVTHEDHVASVADRKIAVVDGMIQ